MRAKLPLLALIPLMLSSAGLARADTWEALSGHFTASNSFSILGSPDFVFGGGYFVDGQYSPTRRTQVLILASQVDYAEPIVTVAFQQNFAGLTKPPEVDLANMRADFSSLFWLGWNAAGEQVIGGNFGRPGWVGLINNGNGTYSANWVVSPDNFATGSGTFSITIAAAVPEPATPAVLLGGLAFLAFAIRRRNQA